MDAETTREVRDAEAMIQQHQEETQSFDATRYLTNLNRGQYLEVKYRLLWLRREHPDAIVETDVYTYDPTMQLAVFRCRIEIPGGGVATGFGSETAGDFRDYLEKAETKAIGRACAALGYGTQFCQDHDFGGNQPDTRVNPGQMKVVDAPVDLTRTRGRAQPPVGARVSGPALRGGQHDGPPDQGDQRATERQVRFIYAIAREAGLDEQELAAWSQELYDMEVEKLNRRDASALIEALQRRRNEVS